MTVRDIVKLSGGAMFRLVDASVVGYMSHPKIIVEADRNVVLRSYGEFEVVPLEAFKRNGITLYVK